MSAEVIQSIELNISQAKGFVTLGDSLARLSNNRDFKKVIREGFFKDEAVRLTHLKGSVSSQSPEDQADIIKRIDGIGVLLGYLQAIQHNSLMASDAIKADRDTIEELLAEEELGAEE